MYNILNKNFFLLLLITISGIISFSCRQTNISGTSSETTNSISGLVTSSGQPSPGAKVVLIPANHNPVVDPPISPEMKTRTDKEGRYYFSEITTGTYNIKIFQPLDSTYAIIPDFLIDDDSLNNHVLPDGKLEKTGEVIFSVVELDVKRNDFLFVQGSDILYQLDSMDIHNGYIHLELPSGTYNTIQHSNPSGMDTINNISVNLDIQPSQRTNTKPFDPWENSYKISIDLKPVDLNQSIYNFPLLIRLNETNFDFNSENNGRDLRFSSTDQIRTFPHEMDSWDPINQTASIWVLLDSIPPTSISKTIHLHSGNSLATNMAHGSVFDTTFGYEGVWHLGETLSDPNSSVNDVTQNKANGIGPNLTDTNSVPGWIGRAVHFESSSNQYIEINEKVESHFDFSEALTVSAWVNVENFSRAYGTIISKGNQTWRLHAANMDANFRLSLTSNNSSKSAATKGPLALDTWYHIVGVFDGISQKIFLNGNLAAQVPADGPIDNDDFQVWIGNNQTYPDRFFDGTIDEVRISSRARSEDWVKLSYESQKKGNMIIIEKIK